MDKTSYKQIVHKSMKKEEIFLLNNSSYLEDIRRSRRGSIIFAASARLKRKYKEYKNAKSVEEKARRCADVLDTYEEMWLWRLATYISIAKEDRRVRKQQKGEWKCLDYSDSNEKDYYSIVVVVRNEARYMREFLLFYKATGADRVYLYDNDSSDNLMEVLDPFIKSGFVIYNSIHGPVVQAYVYRDAVRKTRNRTKWLAAVDADEYLFSPKGDMPQQLKQFERYPGIGVNWLMFGPSGHIHRPEGLIMDNYTETFADRNTKDNRHIKSIVQPARVYFFNHVHYAIYKNSGFAVDENGNKIGNYCAYYKTAGRAFTEIHHDEVFRINHYFTKSLEDLAEKCRRGYADRSDKKRIIEEELAKFDVPMDHDYTIEPYATIVRMNYK